MLNSSTFGDSAVVPVVMFHSVGAENLEWVFNYISSPRDAFEKKISHLKAAGFNFIFWQELYDYMSGRRELALPAVMVTFDDGYLDNWTNVFPILEKYQVKATVFVSTDFIDPSNEPRQRASDAGKDGNVIKKPDVDGFLNFAEMRAMEKSGLVDIQSHAKSHTWYFSGNRVLSFWYPGIRQYPWMTWNARPDRKPFYMHENQEGLVRYGSPIYEHGKSLEVVRYLPAEEITKEVCGYVQSRGGEGFFKEDDWHEQLLAVHDTIAKQYAGGSRVETTTERCERIRNELSESKRILECGLDKQIDFICWPGGGYEPETLEIARSVGYKAWTLSSADQSNYRNVPGADPEQIKRIGSQTRQYWRGGIIGHTNGREFMCTVRRHQGSRFHTWYGRFLRARRIVSHYLAQGSR